MKEKEINWCLHEWEKLGFSYRQLFIWSKKQPLSVIYICRKCLEKKEIPLP